MPEIVAYYPTWVPHSDYLNIDMSAVTTIAYAFCWLEMDSSFTATNDVTNWGYDPTDLITAAHKAGVKVVMSLRDRDNAVDPFLTNPNQWTPFINAVIAEVNNKGYDGVDTDFEIFSSYNKSAFTSFQKQLTTALRNNDPNRSRTSLAFGADITTSESKFDFVSLDPYVDHFMIMLYDWYGNWQPFVAGPSAPNMLDSASDPPWIAGNGNYQSIMHFAKVINPVKLLYGVGWYGKLYRTISDYRLVPMIMNTIAGIAPAVDTPGYKDYINLTTSGLGINRYDSLWQTYTLSYSGGVLENPGFEVNEYAWIKMPEGATGFDPHSSDYSHSGSYSGHISSTSIDGINRYFNQYVYGVSGNTNYPVVAWLKGINISSDNMWDGGASFRISYYDSNFGYISTDNIGVLMGTFGPTVGQYYRQETFDWTQFYYTITTPPNAAIVGIELSLENATGDVYFDDIIFDTDYGEVRKQLIYDNEETLGYKYDVAIAAGCGGIGIWEVSLIGNRTELWNQLKDKFKKVYPNPVCSFVAT
jgi:GH18 family chitinase